LKGWVSNYANELFGLNIPQLPSLLQGARTLSAVHV